MTLEELKGIIDAAGGRENALAYAEALLLKIQRLEATGQYEQLLKQLRGSRHPGDFRGRVLEVNFADQFLSSGQRLTYGVRQGMTGDIDFGLPCEGYDLCMEMKLLGQDQATKEKEARQLAELGVSKILLTDDTRDVARLQLDLMQKGSTKKFNARPQDRCINLVAVDVSELQLGCVDIGDCLLAAGGNPVAARHCHEAVLRPSIVGVFEQIERDRMSSEQRAWVDGVHSIASPAGAPHPRDYIHGALFLFRKPDERAALSYTLSGAVVWNSALVSGDVAQALTHALERVIPRTK